MYQKLKMPTYIVTGVQLQRIKDMTNYARVRNKNRKAVYFLKQLQVKT